MSALLDIFKEIISFGSLISVILFGCITIAFHFKILHTKTLKIISIIAVILCTSMSVEYYPFQLFYSPISLLIPISILVVMIDFFMESITPAAAKTIFVLNIIYAAIGLGFLTSSNNTWGNISAVLGMFIVPNTLLVTLYLSLIIKNHKFLSISFLIIAITNAILIYLITNGFEYGMYDGDFVEMNRNTSILMNCLLLFTGILFYRKWKLR